MNNLIYSHVFAQSYNNHIKIYYNCITFKSIKGNSI